MNFWSITMFACAVSNAGCIVLNVMGGHAGIAALAGFGLGWCLLHGINCAMQPDSASTRKQHGQ